jgi:hypothetical protein
LDQREAHKAGIHQPQHEPERQRSEKGILKGFCQNKKHRRNISGKGKEGGSRQRMLSENKKHCRIIR